MNEFVEFVARHFSIPQYEALCYLRLVDGMRGICEDDMARNGLMSWALRRQMAHAMAMRALSMEQLPKLNHLHGRFQELAELPFVMEAEVSGLNRLRESWLEQMGGTDARPE